MVFIAMLMSIHACVCMRVCVYMQACVCVRVRVSVHICVCSCLLCVHMLCHLSPA